MLGGARFVLLDEDETVLEEWVSDGAEPYTVQCELEFETTYIIRELRAPDGYSKAEDIVFTTLDDCTELVITVKNKPQPPVPTGVAGTGSGPLRGVLLCAGLAVLLGMDRRRKRRYGGAAVK